MKKFLFSLVAILAIITVIGCKPPATAEDIKAETIAASASVNSVSMTMDMNMDINVTGGAQAGNMTMDTQMSISADIAKKEMYMAASMNYNVPIIGSQNVNAEYYLTDGWMYVKVPVGGQDQWVKTKFDEQQWNTQNQLSQQIELLKSALSVTKLPDEKINATDCYVLKVNPDMATLMNWVASQNQAKSTLPNINPEMFKSTTITMWIAKNSNLPQKASMNINIEMTPDDISTGTTTSTPDFQKAAIVMDATVIYSGYNQPVTITLPADASNAQETNSSK